MAFGSAALKITTLAVRILQFCSAAIILGIYSYFLAVQSRHHTVIPRWQKGVEGLSGAAALYTLFGVLLVLFLGSKKVFGFIAIVLDICFFACFIAITILTKDGAHSCNGIVNTPLGRAPSNQDAPGAGNYHYVCGLNSAAFALSIIGFLLFLISAVLTFFMVRRHEAHKRDQLGYKA